MFFLGSALLSLLLAVLVNRGTTLAGVKRPCRVELLGAALVPRVLFALPPLAPVLAQPAPGLPVAWGSALYILSFLLAGLFIWYNRRTAGFELLGLGLFLNALVIVANGGHMPVDPGAMAAAGILHILERELAAGLWSTFTLRTPQTPLWFLGDIILFPIPFREPVIISVGDIAIALGLLRYFNPWVSLAVLWTCLPKAGTLRERQ
jgi:hypothetical protein